jgi:hypothetical protein
MELAAILCGLTAGTAGAAIVIRRVVRGELPPVGNSLLPAFHLRLDTLDKRLALVAAIFFLARIVLVVATYS